jgi:hypothetical protein
VCCCAEGVASPSDIDRCMKLGANHPMGPLALCDMIGLDTILSVMEVLHREFGDDKYRCAAECPPPPLPPCLPLLSPGARLRPDRMAAREKFFPAARNPSSSSWSRSWPAEGWADLSSPIERLLPAACCLLPAACFLQRVPAAAQDGGRRAIGPQGRAWLLRLQWSQTVR